MQNKRLLKEYKNLEASPPPFIIARPQENNLLECHYIITGCPDSPYASGQYHGALSFPKDYPFSPPAIRIFTPNGRFQVNVRLCLSFSDFHKSSWQPSWSISTILVGLVSFMLEDTATTGSISTSNHDKKILAKQSHKFNSKNQKFREIFPDYLVKNEESVDKEIESSIDPNLLQQQPLRHEIKENFIQLKTFAYLMIGLLFYILLNKFTNRL